MELVRNHVDDDPAVRQLLAETLASEGHQVTVISSGLDGVEAVKDQYTSVLTDLRCRGIGLDHRQNLKIDSKVIAIVMTGYGTVDCAVRAMEEARRVRLYHQNRLSLTVAVVVRKGIGRLQT